MKRLFLSLGLSVTILLSAAFAQSVQKKAPAPVAATPVSLSKILKDKKVHQTQDIDPQIAERLGINASKKRAAVPVKRMKPALKHVATYALQDPEKAMVKLVVGDCWDDGSGYQILFDADAHLCDTSFKQYGLDQSILSTYYGMADFTIPANASPVVGSTSVLDFESDSIEITPGVYDVLVVNPSDEAGLWVYVASGESELDDFEFVKGCIYVFEINMEEDYDGYYYDNCSIRVQTPFDLSVETIALPVSCEIDNEVSVTLTVTNNGTADAENIKLWYYVADEEAEDFEPDTIEYTVSGTLAAGKTQTYTFDTKITPVSKDLLYVVYAGVYPLGKESDTTDNIISGCFIKKEGLTELPYEFDLDDYDFIPTAYGAWEMEEGVAEAGEVGSPLVSRCFDLKGGSIYRLSYEYVAGFDLWGWIQIPEDYHIGFGLASEPLSEWDIVLEEEEVFVADWEKNEIVLRPQTDGTYAVYFSADYFGFLSLQNISVSEIADKDVRLNAFDAGFARLMPIEQANGTFAATATIENRGSQTIAKATVEVKMDGTTLSSVEVENMVFGALVDVNIPLTISGLKLGDKPKFVATVTLEGEAETEQKDNTAQRVMEVTDYVMAHDYVDEGMYTIENAIGLEGYSDVAFGLLYSLSAEDTLTAISLGWCDFDDMSIGIRIQKWNKETKTLGAMVYETEVSRGADAGQREYKVPSIILEAGDYMISVLQVTTDACAIVVDDNPDGYFYLIVEDEFAPLSGMGTPAIRAIFGPDAHPMAKDVMVAEIIMPEETGKFTATQGVVVRILNQGYEAVKAPVSLWVNGRPVTNKQVELAAYGSAEVTFVADLSAPNEYTLMVISALEGDEDPTNDTCIKIVRSSNVDNENAARLETRLSVYPNPAREMITLHAQDAVINQVVILNMAGRIVNQSNGLNLTDYRYSVRGLATGMYFARVKTTQGMSVVKFIVK